MKYVLGCSGVEVAYICYEHADTSGNADICENAEIYAQEMIKTNVDTSGNADIREYVDIHRRNKENERVKSRAWLLVSSRRQKRHIAENTLLPCGCNQHRTTCLSMTIMGQRNSHLEN